MGRLHCAVLIGAALFLVACNKTTVRTEDGAIPSKSIAAFEPYLGDYEGSFAGREAVLALLLDGFRAEVLLRDAGGSDFDLLGADCGSSIGDMILARFDQDDLMEFAVFAFDTGACADRATGTEAELLFGAPTDGTIPTRLRVEQSFTVRQVCRREGGDSGGGLSCRNFKQPTYLQGDFRGAGR